MTPDRSSGIGAWLCHHGIHRKRYEDVFKGGPTDPSDADDLPPFQLVSMQHVCQRCGAGVTNGYHREDR